MIYVIKQGGLFYAGTHKGPNYTHDTLDAYVFSTWHRALEKAEALTWETGNYHYVSLLR